MYCNTFFFSSFFRKSGQNPFDKRENNLYKQTSTYDFGKGHQSGTKCFVATIL